MIVEIPIQDFENLILSLCLVSLSQCLDALWLCPISELTRYMYDHLYLTLLLSLAPQSSAPSVP
jgi:hypothetical protein